MRAAVGQVLRKYEAIYETPIHVSPALDEGKIAVGFASKLVPKLDKLGVVIDLAFGDWRKTRLLWAGV